MTARQVAIVNAVIALPPLRSERVRREITRRRRAAQRARRRREEAHGSDRLSRPAPFRMQEQLLEIIGPDGFFVEAGAYDGFRESNTYWLERFHGWRGVLVEPVPELYQEAVRERPQARVFHCALVAQDFPETTVTMHVVGLFSLVPGARGSDDLDEEWVRAGTGLRWEAPHEAEVPARPLGSILAEIGNPRVDLLSLDIEGYEGEALRGLDLERHAPRHVLLETRSEDARARAEAVLGDRYETVGPLSPHDTLYRLRAD